MTRSDEVYEFYVGEGVTLSGATISIEGTARIDGTMDGTIKAGHLIVGIEGKLKGDIAAGTADILGQVEQTLSVSSLLNIKSSGLVQGSVLYGELQCEKGGRIVGEITTNAYDPVETKVVSIADD